MMYIVHCTLVEVTVTAVHYLVIHNEHWVKGWLGGVVVSVSDS